MKAQKAIVFITFSPHFSNRQQFFIFIFFSSFTHPIQRVRDIMQNANKTARLLKNCKYYTMSSSACLKYVFFFVNMFHFICTQLYKSNTDRRRHEVRKAKKIQKICFSVMLF